LSHQTIKLDSLPLSIPKLERAPHTIADSIVRSIYWEAEKIAQASTSCAVEARINWDRKIDDILTSRLWGFPVMLLMLTGVLWLTISGANVPSELLATGLFWLHDRLLDLFIALNAPHWLTGFFVLGVFRSVAWVVSVMLPPMAIFFPLFTLLEDAGYLPRVAFNLDACFKKAGAHGKQALTMCMGLGCNAAGTISCRIIDSPRERLIATLTNNFVPCNGRFPTLIVLSSIFIGGTVAISWQGLSAALSVAAVMVLGVVITLLVSWLLSKTLLKGQPSSFALELPPYRKPKIGEVIIRSILDRTLFVLGRAVVIAAPAGGLVWVLANTSWGDTTTLAAIAGWLDGFARLMGLDGYILLTFILGLPANEIVLPTLIMSYLAEGALLELNSVAALHHLLVEQYGWTWLTAVCVMLFSLCHWPCGTTLYTIKKETNSWKWTGMAFLLPTLVGIFLCMAVTFVVGL
jgi:ferrous iron transport protein B